MGKYTNHLKAIIVALALIGFVGCGSQSSDEPVAQNDLNLVVDAGSKELEAIPSHDRCYDSKIQHIGASANASNYVNATEFNSPGAGEVINIVGRGRVEFTLHENCADFILSADEIWNNVRVEIQIDDKIIVVNWFTFDADKWVAGFKFADQVSFENMQTGVATVRIIYLPTNEIMDSLQFEVQWAAIASNISHGSRTSPL